MKPIFILLIGLLICQNVFCRRNGYQNNEDDNNQYENKQLDGDSYEEERQDSNIEPTNKWSAKHHQKSDNDDETENEQEYDSEKGRINNGWKKNVQKKQEKKIRDNDQEKKKQYEEYTNEKEEKQETVCYDEMESFHDNEDGKQKDQYDSDSDDNEQTDDTSQQQQYKKKYIRKSYRVGQHKSCCDGLDDHVINFLKTGKKMQCQCGQKTCRTDGTWSTCKGVIGPLKYDPPCGDEDGNAFDADCDGKALMLVGTTGCCSQDTVFFCKKRDSTLYYYNCSSQHYDSSETKVNEQYSKKRMYSLSTRNSQMENRKQQYKQTADVDSESAIQNQQSQQNPHKSNLKFESSSDRSNQMESVCGRLSVVDDSKEKKDEHDQQQNDVQLAYCGPKGTFIGTIPQFEDNIQFHQNDLKRYHLECPFTVTSNRHHARQVGQDENMESFGIKSKNNKHQQNKRSITQLISLV